MWECPKCHEKHEDSLEVCWKCAHGRWKNVKDPTFGNVHEAENAVAPARTMANKKPEGAVTVFILGLLGLLLCQILGIIAWVMGDSYMERCRSAGVTPEGLAIAGRIMGIIATALLTISVCGIILMLIAGRFAALQT